MDQPVKNNAGANDLHELNIAYLFCLREMARKDPTEAAVRFGIDVSLAQSVAESSVDRIREIADPAILQFRMRAPNHMRNVVREGDSTSKLLSTITMLAEVSDCE